MSGEITVVPEELRAKHERARHDRRVGFGTLAIALCGIGMSFKTGLDIKNGEAGGMWTAAAVGLEGTVIAVAGLWSATAFSAVNVTRHSVNNPTP